MRKEFRSLISLEEAGSIVLSHAPRPGVEAVYLERALGRILAEKIICQLDVPGFARASMDGFAVQSQDVVDAREDRPITLRLAGSVPMGAPAVVRVDDGEAAEVSTGSMMPQGADAVVMVEYSQEVKAGVLIRRPVHSGENVQAAGSDIAVGEAVLFPGTRLTSREVGVLAALGRETVAVRSLKVGVASTGDELVPPGRPLGPGEIYDINSCTIAAAVVECGGAALNYGILPDASDEMAKTLQKMARECDLVLVSGSTSAGAGDMVYRVLEEIGEVIFHGVNLKPGKPTIFGLIGGKPCLGLPGYPTSALTVFGLLAAPAIRGALGLRSRGYQKAGRLARPLRSESRQQMVAVGVSGELIYPVDRGSGSITTLAGADGVLEIPASVEYLEKGEAVLVRLFTEPDAPDLVVAGENSLLLEKVVETSPLRIRLLNIGSLRGRMLLGEGVSDVACVCDPQPTVQGLVMIMSQERELGLIYRDAQALQTPEKMRLMGWHRDFEMKAIFEAVLKARGISDPVYVRLARTHTAAAAAVAQGSADLGFCERGAADQANLGFLSLRRDELQFLVTVEKRDHPAVRSFLSALSSAAAAEKFPSAARSS